MQRAKPTRCNWISTPAPPPAKVIESQNLPLKLCHLVLIDGVFIPPAERAKRALAEGETLAIWPPIAGG